MFFLNASQKQYTLNVQAYRGLSDTSLAKVMEALKDTKKYTVISDDKAPSDLTIYVMEGQERHGRHERIQPQNNELYVELAYYLYDSAPTPHILRMEMGILNMNAEISTKFLRTIDEQLKKTTHKNHLKSFPISNKSLLDGIEKMRDYGMQLTQNNAAKGVIVTELADELKEMAAIFFTDLSKSGSEESRNGFKSQFIKKLNSKNEIMSEYRTNWMSIIKNILLICTGIGIIVQVGHLLHSKTTQDRFLWFFQEPKTTSELNVKATQERFETVVDTLS